MAIVLKIILGLVGTIVLIALVTWLAFARPNIPYAKLEAKYASKSSKYVDLPGGVRAHYRDEGNPAGPVILLLHGYGDSSFSWDGWSRVLGDRYRIVILDLPGHGLTRTPKGYRATSDGYVALVEDFAAKVGLKTFALGGNSMGGGISWRYALAHPERLDALILDAAAGWPSPAKGPPPLAFRILGHPIGRAVLKTIDNKPLIRQGVRGQVGDPTVITDAFIDRWADLQRGPGHRDILMSIDLGSASGATPETVARITTPTLVLHGEIDPILSVEGGRKFAQHIPGAKLITYPGVGHLPQVEIPDRSAKDVADFLGALTLQADKQPKVSKTASR